MVRKRCSYTRNLTSEGQKDVVVEAIKEGAKGYIVKPPNKQKVCDNARKAIKQLGQYCMDKRLNHAIIQAMEDISGAFTLGCSVRVATLIAEKMLGMEGEEGSNEMKDAIGELLNAKDDALITCIPFKCGMAGLAVGIYLIQTDRLTQ